MPWEKWKWKHQKQPIQVARQGHENLPGPSKETPKTPHDQLRQQSRKTSLFNWMTVYAYVDTLPRPRGGSEILCHKTSGRIAVQPATLSRKLRQRPEMEAHVDSIPSALSCKWPHVVTRPNVDSALWLWVQQMDQKGEVVNSRTLMV